MKLLITILITLTFVLSAAVRADDWPCEVVLCLANPAGATAVAPCVQPIQKLWRELAKGHSFPVCNMNSPEASGNSAANQWASGSNCPSEYRYWGGVDGRELLCEFTGVVTVKINGQPYTRVWWNEGSTMTQYLGVVPPGPAPLSTEATPAISEK